MKSIALLGLAILGCASSTPAVEGRTPPDARVLASEFRAGADAYDRGDFVGATARLSNIIEQEPTHGMAQLYLGMALREQHDKKAHEHLQKAAELLRENPRARYQLGLAYQALGRPDEALTEFRAAVALRRDFVEALYGMALALADLGRPAQAIAAQRDVLQREPHHVAALAAIAELYELTSNLAGAENALLAITSLYPSVPYHRYRLAKFYERTGEAQKAAQVIAELEKRDPRVRPMRPLR